MRVRNVISSFCLFVSFYLSVVNGTFGAVLISYGFDGGSLSPTVITTGALAGPISHGGALAFSSNASLGNPAPAVEMSFITSATAPDAVAQDDFFRLNIQAYPNFILSLTGISFDVAAGNALDEGPRNFFVQYGTAGGFVTAGSGTRNGSTSFLQESYALPNILVALPASATIRIYGYIPGAGSNATSLLFDNITIFGTVTEVPEPSTATILLLPAAAFFPRRRRKR